MFWDPIALLERRAKIEERMEGRKSIDAHLSVDETERQSVRDKVGLKTACLYLYLLSQTLSYHKVSSGGRARKFRLTLLRSASSFY